MAQLVVRRNSCEPREQQVRFVWSERVLDEPPPQRAYVLKLERRRRAILCYEAGNLKPDCEGRAVRDTATDQHALGPASCLCRRTARNICRCVARSAMVVGRLGEYESK